MEERVRALEIEMIRQRERSHKLVDTVQGQEGRVARLEWEVGEVKADITKLATADQLHHLRETLEPIRRGVYAVVWLILATVIGAGLMYLLRSSGG